MSELTKDEFFKFSKVVGYRPSVLAAAFNNAYMKRMTVELVMKGSKNESKSRAKPEVRVFPSSSTLVRKLKDLELAKIGESSALQKYNSIELVDALGEKFNITNIVKTAMFGGGTGARGGAATADKTEPLVAFGVALAFAKGDTISGNDLSKKSLINTAIKRTLNGAPIDQYIQEIENGDLYNMIQSANAIYTELKSLGFKGTIYSHFGDAVVKHVYNAYKECKKNDVDKQAPGTFAQDKWNPGDIWISNSNNPNDFILPTASWSELNKAILNYAIDTSSQKRLIGISLKKVIQPRKPTVTEINKDKKLKSVLKFKGFTISAETKKDANAFFDNAKTFIHADYNGRPSVAEFRNFSGAKGFQAELQGITAAAGKVGAGNIIHFLEEAGIDSNNIDINNYEFSQTNTTLIKNYYDLYKEVSQDNKNLNKTKILDFNSFQAGINKRFTKDQNNGFATSKLKGLKIIKKLLDATSKKRDKFITSAGLYGLSQSDQSSFHLKVQ